MKLDTPTAPPGNTGTWTVTPAAANAMKGRITALVSALVVAVGEAGRSNGETYALVMSVCSLSFYTEIIGLCEVSGILSARGHFLSLTAKGKALLAEIRAAG